MLEKLKKFLKNIGVFQYYMSLKRKIYLNKKLKRLEELQSRKRIDFYREIINPGDLCFDVGANIGNRCESFLELGANVVAVEPQDACVAILKEKFKDRIKIEQVGLAKEEGEIEMYIADESTISTFSKDFIDNTKDTKFKNNSWKEKTVVKVTTLDKLITKHKKPDFCKIDVEGFEFEVLAGLSNSINKISFEYNVPEMANNVRLCLAKLNELSTNYRFNYCIGESMELHLKNWLTFKEFSELVEKPDFINSDFGDIYAFIQNKEDI